LGDTFSGYSTFRYRKFQQSLQKKNIHLQYADEFNQAQRARLLNQGNADLLITTLDQYLQQQPQGRIVGLIDTTIGADAVVLNTKKYPQLQSLEDLTELVRQTRSRGERLSITFAADTPSEHLAQVLSAKFETFQLSDFNQQKVADASQAWKLLQDPNQPIAVAVLWEPYVTQARQQGYTVALSSKDTPGAILDVIVGSDRLLQGQPEKLTTLIEQYYQHIDASLINPREFQQQLADDGNLSVEDTQAVLNGIDFFTALEAKRMMESSTLSRRIRSTASVLKRAGKIDQMPSSPQTLFTSRFLTQPANNTKQLLERLGGSETLPTATPQVNTSELRMGASIGSPRLRGGVQDIQFDTGSAELTESGKQILDELAEMLLDFNAQTVGVRVTGHTSESGGSDYNLELSQLRAQTVRDYLQGRGVSAEILAEGQGSNQHIADVDPDDPRNQRVDFRLVRIER
jgi:outer membrane protein OmpA-like peptidoglycan-associated protein